MHALTQNLLVVCLAATPLLPAQTTVVLQCAQDNTLYEDAAGALSNGLGNSLFVGVTGQPGLRRALVQFDVATNVPAGARIVAAELTITSAQSSFGGVLNVNGHRALAAWGEGTSVAPGQGGGGGTASNGDATWLHTSFPSTFWTSAGGDFSAAASLVIETPPNGAASSSPSTAMLADVQSWLDNPATNHGWLLKTDEALAFMTRRLDSRESTNVGARPTLTITYLQPGESTTYGTGCPVGTGTFGYAITGTITGGTTVNLDQTNGPANQAAVNLLSLGFDPAGFPLLSGCQLYLPLGAGLLTHSIVLLDGSGAGSTPFTLPSGFPGVALYSQSAAIDSSPEGFVLSNAAIALLQ